MINNILNQSKINKNLNEPTINNNSKESLINYILNQSTTNNNEEEIINNNNEELTINNNKIPTINNSKKSSTFVKTPECIRSKRPVFNPKTNDSATLSLYHEQIGNFF